MPTERRISEGEIAALPLVEAVDGRLICVATGRELCPLGTAVANRLGGDRIALWEPGRRVLLVDGKNPSGVAFGEHGIDRGKYAVALAVGPYKGGVAIVDGQRRKLVQLSRDGKFEREEDLPPPTASAAPGFIGDRPVLQSIRAETDSGVAHLRLEIMTSQQERGGKLVLNAPIPWLRMRGDSTVSFTPLFPQNPAYAVDQGETIVWAPADSFLVERRTFDGAVKWRLTSDRRGLTVTPEDIERRRAEIMRTVPAGALRPGELDSMTAANAATHPVISAIVVEPGGRVLLAGSMTPTRDSVEYLLLSRDGEATNRLMLHRRTRPLLFAGDSILVHRPTAGEPQEIRWLTLRAAQPASAGAPK